MDKDTKRIIDKVLKQATRIADSLDKLVNEPLVEVKSPPPQCPHCGTINPIVNVYQHPETKGRVAEFLIAMKCTHCEKDIYGLTVEWSIQPDEESALMEGRQIVARLFNG